LKKEEGRRKKGEEERREKGEIGKF